MKIIYDFLLRDVKIKTSHLWMVGLGLVICLGFFVNCAVAPFMSECNPIDNEQLILAASIVAGLGTARQVVLLKFKYLADLQPFTEKEKATAEEILKERLWVPCVGWALVIGFAVNMLVVPFFHDFRLVDWSFLQSSIGIFLTISGAREIGIYSQRSEHIAKATPQQPET
ncbi:MAG: hypothetical protein IJ218_03975 [Alphaproteobacteria bacterium]|nr:hypothetical protein [Alphaproteobacteria bacterium]